jgi:5-methylcytosine-specific restriction endonuclease McrBC GTP-binding regulatory subunit McrB
MVQQKELSVHARRLKSVHNMILRGAPGTGKTYLSQTVAAEIIGCNREDLAESDQFGFVQFHPSYDYTDFVEGLRPVTTDAGQVGFEIKDGIFKEFCKKAHAQKSNFDEVYQSFTEFLEENTLELMTPKKKNKFYVELNSNNNVYAVPQTEKATRMPLSKKSIQNYVEKGEVLDWRPYVASIGEYIKSNYNVVTEKNIETKPYVFVIDEINRGEISKIFGELFFSIDPEYRGKSGAVSTQYSNLFEDEEKFYIPENVYIIGTMNDIDRSVDTFDFAMRRRFTFVEVTACDSQVMLKTDEVKARMNALNDALVTDEIGLSEDYQIGASYFKSMEDEVNPVTAEELWENKLEPLLKDYFRGERNWKKKLDKLRTEYEKFDVVERFESEEERELVGAGYAPTER